MSVPRRSKTGSRSSDRQRSSRTPRPRTGGSRYKELHPALQWAAGHLLLICLTAILLLAFLAEMPWLSRPLRAITLQADVVLVFTLIAAGHADEGLSALFRRGLNPWILALLAWCGLSAYLAPYHPFAMAELLRLALGAGIYYAAAFVLRPPETRLMPLVLLGFGASAGLYGLIQFGSAIGQGDGEVTSIFGNHEQFGSLLALLFPPALALALDRERLPKELLFAQGAALILGAALLLARTRSAWAGAAVGCILLSGLVLRSGSKHPRAGKALLIGPVLIVMLAFVGLLTFSQLAPLVSTRAATLSHALDDTSFSDRLHRWRSACRMASEHPVAGWGLGTWPVMQGRWTHQGDDIPEVLLSGTGHSNLAHNFWVQWAAETGGVGLALHLGLFAAFFFQSLRALSRLDRDRRTLLMACLAGVASGCVDMFGAPSYTFPGVSSLLWLWLGLGQAVLRESGDRLRPQPLASAASAGIGLAAALIVLGVGWNLRARGSTTPRGTLTVVAQPAGPVLPGTRVLWAAVYHDPSGRQRSSAPGAVWDATQGHLENAIPTYTFVNAGPQCSGWQGNVPSNGNRVTMTAYYWDNFSREYAASGTVDLQAAKKH